MSRVIDDGNRVIVDGNAGVGVARGGYGGGSGDGNGRPTSEGSHSTDSKASRVSARALSSMPGDLIAMLTQMANFMELLDASRKAKKDQPRFTAHTFSFAINQLVDPAVFEPLCEISDFYFAQACENLDDKVGGESKEDEADDDNPTPDKMQCHQWVNKLFGTDTRCADTKEQFLTELLTPLAKTDRALNEKLCRLLTLFILVKPPINNTPTLMVGVDASAAAAIAMTATVAEADLKEDPRCLAEACSHMKEKYRHTLESILDLCVQVAVMVYAQPGNIQKLNAARNAKKKRTGRDGYTAYDFQSPLSTVSGAIGSQLTELQAEIKRSKEGEIAKITDELKKALNGINSALSEGVNTMEHQAALAVLQRELEEARARTAEMAAELATKEAEAKELKEGNEFLMKTITEDGSTAEKFDTIAKKAIAERDGAIAEIAKLKAEVQEHDDASLEAEGLLEEAERELKAVKVENAALQEERDTATAERDKALETAKTTVEEAKKFQVAAKKTVEENVKAAGAEAKRVADAAKERALAAEARCRDVVAAAERSTDQAEATARAAVRSAGRAHDAASQKVAIGQAVSLMTGQVVTNAMIKGTLHAAQQALTAASLKIERDAAERVAEADGKASEAERRADKAEAKASAAEEHAAETERSAAATASAADERAIAAERSAAAKVSEADGKASEAERRADEAEARASTAEGKLHEINQDTENRQLLARNVQRLFRGRFAKDKLKFVAEFATRREQIQTMLVGATYALEGLLVDPQLTTYISPRVVAGLRETANTKDINLEELQSCAGTMKAFSTLAAKFCREDKIRESANTMTETIGDVEERINRLQKQAKLFITPTADDHGPATATGGAAVAAEDYSAAAPRGSA